MAFEIFEMNRGYRRYDRDMRPHHRGERRDFARVVHADFEHAESGMSAAFAPASAARPNDCCRKQPAHGLPPAGASTSRSASFVDGLARRTGHRDDPRRRTRARGGARRSSAAMYIGHDIERPEPAQRLGMRFVDHRRGGAAFRRPRRHNRVRPSFALDGEKKFARLERARVDGNRRWRRRRHGRLTRARERADESETRPQERRGCSCASSLSSAAHRFGVGEWQRLVADDLSGLVALAGDEKSVVLVASIAMARPNGRSPVADLLDLVGARRPQDRRADRGRILGARIVVGDDDGDRPGAPRSRP